VLSAVPLAANGASTSQTPSERVAAAAAPSLRVTTVMRGLDIPWDTAFLPSGGMLVTERSRKRILLRGPRGRVRVVANDPPGIWSSFPGSPSSETGLMSLAVDPRFRSNRRFYTCHGSNRRGGGHDVRVVAWRLNDRSRHARRTEVLVRGIPIRTGRHGGCRLEIDPRGRLWVGTGDAAIGRNPQRLRSLGGKVLRINRFTGGPARGNPYPRAANRNKRRVFTHGHRNVQGLAWRPGDGMWSVEHGPEVSDEVNRLVRGGDYGWNPVPGYNESVPMTDHSLPGRQRSARWTSGPTPAPSGSDWLTHRRWGAWRGRLAVGMLQGSHLRVMRFGGQNRLRSERVPPALNGRFGRLRSVTLGPRGALYVTTSNGGGNDRVLRVTPR
jgi:glucose/arabinose dehydrogenase